MTTPLYKRVLDMMRHFPPGTEFSPSEIAAQMGEVPERVGRCLHRSVGHGEVERPRTGCYRLPVQHRAPRTPKPPPLRETIVVRQDHQDAVLHLLRGVERPLSRTLILTRLHTFQLTPPELNGVLGVLMRAGKVRETTERLIEARP